MQATPLVSTVAVVPAGQKFSGRFMMPIFDPARVWLRTLTDSSFGPREAWLEAFILRLLFILLFLWAFLVLLCKGTLLIGFPQLFVDVGGDGKVAGDVFQQGRAAHDLSFIT